MSMQTEGKRNPHGASYDPEGLAKLCERFDALFADSNARLDKAHASELLALARIFDIASDSADAPTWQAVRSVLQQDSRPASPAIGDAAAKLTVMIVEDDPDVAEDLVMMFVDAGYDLAGPFHDADVAEVSACLQRIDLAVVDINLSGAASGIDLARALGMHWDIPVVFLSGDHAAASANRHLAAAFVAKPFKAADLLSAIDALKLSG
ncbi:response regulator [Brevundimonas nasdae]|uniref:response regulator n=1 Tax=Brevundimonas nasdae TaxID=172043 RepID=UPI003F68EAE0